MYTPPTESTPTAQVEIEREEARKKRARVGEESDAAESSGHEGDTPLDVDDEWDTPDLGRGGEVEELVVVLLSDDEEEENATMAVIWAEVDHG